jgi:predicted component of type VI protein secretion system
MGFLGFGKKARIVDLQTNKAYTLGKGKPLTIGTSRDNDIAITDRYEGIRPLHVTIAETRGEETQYWITPGPEADVFVSTRDGAEKRLSNSGLYNARRRCELRLGASYRLRFEI